MAPPPVIHVHPSTDPAGAALERLDWAQRRRAAAADEVTRAQRRLVAAEEQLRRARAAVRETRERHASRATDEQMIGMGFFADEVAHGTAA
jgi:hypothetical protein